jgi:hypothetical protein
MKRTTSSLKPFADVKKTKGLLLPEIRAHVVEQAVQHGDDDRSSTLLHVSELVKSDWCPRQAYYKLSHTPPSDPRAGINYRMETIFGHGHTEHTKWQTWMAEMGILYGTWYCHNCKTSWVGGKENDGPWDWHGGHHVVYNELSLADPEYPIIGHADGAVAYLRALVEIKTIGLGTIRFDAPELVRQYTVKTKDRRSVVDYDALWKGINRPFRSHLLQARFYLWMCKRLGLPFERMVFVYENKANQDTREFVIPYSTTGIEDIIDSVEKVMAAVEAGKVVDRPEKFDKEKRPCVGCVFRSKCWGENDDTDQTAGQAQPRARRRRLVSGPGEAGEVVPAETSVAPAEGVPTTPRRPRRSRGRDDHASAEPVHRVGVVPRRSTLSRRD